jgi:hypothetical protein
MQMDKKKAGALAIVVLVGIGACLGDEKRVHVELRAEPIPTTSTTFASGGQSTFFDNEAFAPAMPWASWMPGFKFPEHLVSWPLQLLLMMPLQGI